MLSVKYNRYVMIFIDSALETGLKMSSSDFPRKLAFISNESNVYKDTNLHDTQARNEMTVNSNFISQAKEVFFPI